MVIRIVVELLSMHRTAKLVTIRLMARSMAFTYIIPLSTDVSSCDQDPQCDTLPIDSGKACKRGLPLDLAPRCKVRQDLKQQFVREIVGITGRGSRHD